MLSLLFVFQPPLEFLNTPDQEREKYALFICSLTAMSTFLHVIRNIIMIIQKIIPGFNNTENFDK